MHLIQFREIIRDAELAYTIHPIVPVPRAADVAQISSGSFLNNDYATNRPTKQRDLF